MMESKYGPQALTVRKTGSIKIVEKSYRQWKSPTKNEARMLNTMNAIEISVSVDKLARTVATVSYTN
jgi:hypothetical protein